MRRCERCSACKAIVSGKDLELIFKCFWTDATDQYNLPIRMTATSRFSWKFRKVENEYWILKWILHETDFRYLLATLSSQLSCKTKAPNVRLIEGADLLKVEIDVNLTYFFFGGGGRAHHLRITVLIIRTVERFVTVRSRCAVSR